MKILQVIRFSTGQFGLLLLTSFRPLSFISIPSETIKPLLF